MIAQADLIDLLAPHAWTVVENYDCRAATHYFEDVADREGYLLARFEFVLRVLIDVASLPSTEGRP